MDATVNVYVGIFPLCGILIADEVWICPLIVCPYDLDWNNAVVSWWHFES